MKRRGVYPRCPTFRLVETGIGRQEECITTRGGNRFLVVRYPRTGRLTAWLVPPRGPIGGRRLPVATPMTRSLDRLLDDATAFVDKVHRRQMLNGRKSK